MLLRGTVAIQAPLHREWLGAAHERHFTHVAMATKAANSLMDVDAVIEINVIR